MTSGQILILIHISTVNVKAKRAEQQEFYTGKSKTKNSTASDDVVF